MKKILRKQLLLPALLLGANLFMAVGTFAQTTNDFRSRQDGNWDVTTTWETYNGTAWVNASSYPGQSSNNANTVTIRNTHEVDIRASVPQPIGALVVGVVGDDVARLRFFSGGNGQTRNLTVLGNVSVNDGSIILNDGSGNTGHNLTIGGSLTVVNGSIFNAVMGNDRINTIFNSTTSPISIGGGGTIIFNIVSFNNSGVAQITSDINVIQANAAGSMTVGASSTIEPTSNVQINPGGAEGSIQGSGTVRVTRTLPSTNPDFITQYRFATRTLTSLRVDYSGAGDQTINALDYSRLRTSGSGDKTLAGNITVSNSVVVSPNSSLLTESYQVGGGGSFTVEADGQLSTANPGGFINAIATTGAKNFDPLARYIIRGATTTPFPTYINEAQDLLIGADVTLNKNFTVSNVLTLSSGKFTIPVGFELHISSGEGVAGAPFSAEKHIVTEVVSNTQRGIVRLSNQTGTSLVPVGNGTYYLPITLVSGQDAGNNFNISVFVPITTNGQPGGTAFSEQERRQVVNAVWTVQRTGGTEEVQMTLGWPQELEGAILAPLNGNDLGISIHDGTTWQIPQGELGENGDEVNNVTRASILANEFVAPYAFSVGRANTQIVLPVKFAHVKATRKGNGVDVYFANLTEESVAVYHVERSTNGYHFQSIGTLAPKANHNARVDYLFNDAAPVAGDNYYRIRAVETGGKQVYSSVVKVGINGAAPSLVLYPNPATKTSGVNLQLANLPAGVYSIRLFNSNGQVIATKQLQHTGGSLSEALPLQGAGAGRYIVEVKGAVQFTQSFLLQ